jgi:hypothetical protein
MRCVSETNLNITAKIDARKGCEIYFVHVYINVEKLNKNMLTEDPILKEFQDVFLEEILGLPPRRDIDFTIDLMPGSAPCI